MHALCILTAVLGGLALGPSVYAKTPVSPFMLALLLPSPTSSGWRAVSRRSRRGAEAKVATDIAKTTDAGSSGSSHCLG